MVITWVLIPPLLIVVLLQMGFLGRYFSITQNIFHNKTLASFGLGASIYFALTMIVLFPFVWIDLSLVWYVVIIFIKDFFTCVFLIVRREMLKGWKVNKSQALGMTIIAIVLPIFYYFGLREWDSLKHLPVYISQERGSNFYGTYSIWIDVLVKICQGNRFEVENFIVAPIVSIVIFSAIGGLYYEFIKIKSPINVLIVLILTFLIASLFNFHLYLIDLLFLGFIILLVHSGYNIIMYSRRRYGTLFGIITIVTWAANPLSYWTIFFIGLAVALFYILIKGRRPSIFIAQIMSPMLVTTAMKLSYISVQLSFILASLAIILYISIFVVGRLGWVERTNFVFAYAGYIWLIASIFVVIITALSLGFTHNSFEDIWTKGNEISNKTNNSTYNLFLNVSYYVLSCMLVLLAFLFAIRKTKMIKTNILFVICLIITVVGFNPLTHSIFVAVKINDQYQYISVAIYPILIISVAPYWEKLKMKRARL